MSSVRIRLPLPGPLVKRLRHRPFTAVTWVRFPYGSPEKFRHTRVGTFLYQNPYGNRRAGPGAPTLPTAQKTQISARYRYRAEIPGNLWCPWRKGRRPCRPGGMFSRPWEIPPGQDLTGKEPYRTRWGAEPSRGHQRNSDALASEFFCIRTRTGIAGQGPEPVRPATNSLRS